jgi:hypothetical protein
VSLSALLLVSLPGLLLMTLSGLLMALLVLVVLTPPSVASLLAATLLAATLSAVLVDVAPGVLMLD